MRILFFSDLRLGGGDSYGVVPRLHALIRLARQHEVDVVCCGGNLFDDTATTETVGLLRRDLTALDPIPVVIAPGYLDPWADGSPYAALRADNITVFDQPTLSPLSLDGLTVWGAAFSPYRRGGVLDRWEHPESGLHVLLFQGCERTGYDRAVCDGLMSAPPIAAFTEDELDALDVPHVLAGLLPVPHLADRYTCPGWASAAPGSGQAPGATIVTIEPGRAADARWVELAEQVEAPTVEYLPAVDPPAASPPAASVPPPAASPPVSPPARTVWPPAPVAEPQLPSRSAPAAWLPQPDEDDPAVRAIVSGAPIEPTQHRFETDPFSPPQADPAPTSSGPAASFALPAAVATAMADPLWVEELLAGGVFIEPADAPWPAIWPRYRHVVESTVDPDLLDAVLRAGWLALHGPIGNDSAGNEEM